MSPATRTLYTPRLALRPPREEDLPAIINIFSDPDVCRYLGDGSTRSPDQCERSLRNALNCWRDRGFGPFMIHAAERVIGDCLLVPIVRSGADPNEFDQRGPEIEIGYRLAREHWGKGYATEAARAVLTWALGADGAGPALERIIAVTYPQNAASRRVLEKLGMRCLGETDAYYNVTTVLYETVGQGADHGQEPG